MWVGLGGFSSEDESLECVSLVCSSSSVFQIGN